MVIQGIPAGDIKGGSTRLRYYHRKDYMPEDVVWKDYEGKLDCDVLYIQKKANKLDLIKEAKSKGIPVVYDSDDGDGVRRKGDDRPIFAIVDAITTDTEFRAKAFRKITDTPVYVVRDGIDYMDSPPELMKINDKIKHICTFGSFRSTKSAIKYLLPLLKKYKISYITDREVPQLKKCRYIEWKYKKFVRRLQEHDLCIITHRDDEEKAWKGEARLVAAMSVGIPTLCSNTPSFVETMRECGTEEFVVCDPSEVSSKIKLLKDKNARQRVQKQFLYYVWKKFHPKVFALSLADIFRGVCNANTDVQ